MTAKELMNKVRKVRKETMNNHIQKVSKNNVIDHSCRTSLSFHIDGKTTSIYNWYKAN